MSLLSLQELLFVLEKLKAPKDMIIKNYLFFQQYAYHIVNNDIFNRAFEISHKTTFKNINDAIHTAIAEKFCDKLVTYNEHDFKKIKKYTNLKIEIL